MDSLAELAFVETIAAERKAVAKIVLRVTTGVHAGGHNCISTAHEDQEFGLSVASGTALRAVEDVGGRTSGARRPALAHRLTDSFAGCFRSGNGVDSGAARRGIHDVRRDHPRDRLWWRIRGALYPRYWTTCRRRRWTSRRRWPRLSPRMWWRPELAAPTVSIEPGRSIAAPSTVTLYTVGAIKTIQLDEGSRRYVSVDGGSGDNIRPALYGANYTVALANREPSEEHVVSRVVGKHCRGGDIVIKDVRSSAEILGPATCWPFPPPAPMGVRWRRITTC